MRNLKSVLQQLPLRTYLLIWMDDMGQQVLREKNERGKLDFGKKRIELNAVVARAVGSNDGGSAVAVLNLDNSRGDQSFENKDCTYSISLSLYVMTHSAVCLFNSRSQ